MKYRPWLSLALVLGVVWLGASIALRGIRQQKPTAEHLIAFVRTTDLNAVHGSERAHRLEKLAEQVNRLPFEERQKLREGEGLRDIFEQMNSDERSRFLDRTLPTGFREIMEAFNTMTSEERRRHVERALRDMRSRAQEIGPGRLEERLDDAEVRKIIDQGLQSFYRDSTAETKMDLAPLIEEMQAQMQGFHHR